MSVDTILTDFKRGVISAHNNNYGENVWNAEDWAQKQAVEALHSLLISKLPEKRPTIEQFRGTDLKYDAGAFDGYNKCLDDMHRVIDEMFNTKEKIQ